MTHKLFLLGDSISISYTPFLKQYLPMEISFTRKHGAEEFLIQDDLVRKDENGGDSRMVLRYLELGKDQIEADIMLINCGLHDIRREKDTREIAVSSELYKENLEKIIDTARKIAKKVVWVNTTPMNQETHNSLNLEFDRFEEDLTKYNKIACEVMDDKKVDRIYLDELMNKFNIEKVLADHVHFNEDTCKVQGAYIAGWLESLISK